MDIKKKFNEMDWDLKMFESKLAKFRVEFDASILLTEKLLRKCMDKGVTKVSVRKKHKSLPGTETFPFGCCNSIFTFTPKSNKNANESPAIWRIADELGIHGGCGNSEQVQITAGANVIDGVYHLKSGIWHKVD